MEDTVNRLLRLLHLNYQLWRCPTCGRIRRTLTRNRLELPPFCGHVYTKFQEWPFTVMVHQDDLDA